MYNPTRTKTNVIGATIFLYNMTSMQSVNQTLCRFNGIVLKYLVKLCQDSDSIPTKIMFHIFTL